MNKMLNARELSEITTETYTGEHIIDVLKTIIPNIEELTRRIEKLEKEYE